eukprot:TRINITY_DN92083_c1_g1_i1.p3 TRINITY_DN92083_c1_g1~~TRINITY_DN92083_c1_g1_i1.p3  ORF type:complete len:119 (+),score=2.86 TRINITY_DN92083_c1_g1_i1:111-467(+)
MLPKIQISAKIGTWQLTIGHRQKKRTRKRGQEAIVYNVDDVADRIVSLSNALFRMFAVFVSIYCAQNWESLPWTAAKRGAAIGATIGFLFARKYNKNRKSRFNRITMYRIQTVNLTMS